MRVGSNPIGVGLLHCRFDRGVSKLDGATRESSPKADFFGVGIREW